MGRTDAFGDGEGYAGSKGNVKGISHGTLYGRSRATVS